MFGRQALQSAAIAATLTVLIAMAAPPAIAVPGDRDPTFGTRGIVFVPNSSGRAVAVYPGGGYVAVGVTQREGSLLFTVAKVTDQGLPDATFGGDGLVEAFGSDGIAHGVVVQPDGKIVAVGSAGRRYALARFLPSGDLDPMFGDGGMVVEGTGGLQGARDVVLLPSGKLLVAGEGNLQFAVARFLPDGSLDQTFGDGGVVTTAIRRDRSRALGIARGPGGSFVLAGGIHGFRVIESMAFARYQADGDLDQTFGRGGVVVTRFGEFSEADEVVVAADGSVLACGSSFFQAAQRYDFALVRYEPDGDPDSAFSDNGRRRTIWGPPGSEAGCTGLALLPGGKIVAAGSVDFAAFAVSQYQADGDLDQTFGGNGKVRTLFDGAEAQDLVLDANRIIVVGAAALGGRNGCAFVRYLRE